MVGHGLGKWMWERMTSSYADEVGSGVSGSYKRSFYHQKAHVTMAM